MLEGQYTPYRFPGDTPGALDRPRGLPIGNLTSQFWSNCYLDALDHFITDTLGCTAYVRYVDDMVLFADDKPQLWRWKSACRYFLAGLRLRIHEHSAQAVPCEQGIPWLGFVITPKQIRLKSRNSRHATRRLTARYQAWQRGEISFGGTSRSRAGSPTPLSPTPGRCAAGCCNAPSRGAKKNSACDLHLPYSLHLEGE